jgi:hypothetical protein
MKHFHNGYFYTDLGRRIIVNDLLNDIRRVLDESKRFHDQRRTHHRRVLKLLTTDGHGLTQMKKKKLPDSNGSLAK